MNSLSPGVLIGCSSNTTSNFAMYSCGSFRMSGYCHSTVTSPPPILSPCSNPNFQATRIHFSRGATLSGPPFLEHIVFPGGHWKNWKTASRRFAVQKATNNAASSAHALRAEMSLLNNSRLRCGFGPGGNREGKNSIKAAPWFKKGESCKCAQRQKYATLFCSITMIISPKFSYFKPNFKIFLKHIWCRLGRCFPAGQRERATIKRTEFTSSPQSF